MQVWWKIWLYLTVFWVHLCHFSNQNCCIGSNAGKPCVITHSAGIYQASQWHTNTWVQAEFATALPLVKRDGKLQRQNPIVRQHSSVLGQNRVGENLVLLRLAPSGGNHLWSAEGPEGIPEFCQQKRQKQSRWGHTSALSSLGFPREWCSGLFQNSPILGWDSGLYPWLSPVLLDEIDWFEAASEPLHWHKRHIRTLDGCKPQSWADLRVWK